MNGVFSKMCLAGVVALVAGCAALPIPPALAAARAAHNEVRQQPAPSINQGEFQSAALALNVAEAEAQRDPTTWQAADSSYVAQRRMETVLVHSRQRQLEAHRAQLQRQVVSTPVGAPVAAVPVTAVVAAAPPIAAAPNPTVIAVTSPSAVRDDPSIAALTSQVQRLQREVDRARQQEKDREAQQKKVADEKQARAQADQIRTLRQQEEAALQRKQVQLDEMRRQLDLERESRLQADALSRLAPVHQDSRGLVLALSGSSLFAAGKSALLPSGRRTLDEVANALKHGQQRPIAVEGYTDSRGSDRSNARLSQQRAEVVRDYLIAQGIPQELLTARGLGSTNPVANNSSAEGRASNRRVELVLASPAQSATGGSGRQLEPAPPVEEASPAAP